jgi:hypothetical protein
MSDDHQGSFDKIMENGMKALSEAGAKAEAERQEAQLENSNRRYSRLSDEQWHAVLDDLKEYLRLTENQRRFEKLVNGMMESVPKHPTIH